MGEPKLIVPVTDVARRLGISDPTPEQIAEITDAIEDCQADVEAALNRPLVPTEQTLTAIYPKPGMDLTSWRAWPDGGQFDDDYTPKSWTANPDGTYDVVFTVGLDAANVHPIARYVRIHAIESIRENPQSIIGAKRKAVSISAEGQSVSYEQSNRYRQQDSAGSLPNIKTLTAYKRRAVFRRDRANVNIWPYDGIRPVDVR